MTYRELLAYRKYAIELMEAMEPLDVETLEEFNQEWQQELEQQGFSEKLRTFCRVVTEVVIDRKKASQQ